jgi:hypothetical protein
VGTSDAVGDRTGRKAIGLSPDEKPKNLKPGRLTECRKGCESVRQRHSVPALLRPDMADHS